MKRALSTAITEFLGAAHWHLNLRPEAAAGARSSGDAQDITVEAANVEVEPVSDEVSAMGTLRSNGDGFPVSVLDESAQQRGDVTAQQDDDT